jgi:hypothetical protein
MGKGLTRYRRKVDGNHKFIGDTFRKLGYAVFDTHTLGSGYPDFHVSKGGSAVLVEVKDGSLPASQRKFSEDEEQFWLTWLGPIILVLNEQDVVAYDKKRHKRVLVGSLSRFSR